MSIIAVLLNMLFEKLMLCDMGSRAIRAQFSCCLPPVRFEFLTQLFLKIVRAQMLHSFCRPISRAYYSKNRLHRLTCTKNRGYCAKNRHCKSLRVTSA